jgi:hypothetical protein
VRNVTRKSIFDSCAAPSEFHIESPPKFGIVVRVSTFNEVFSCCVTVGTSQRNVTLLTILS